MNIQIYICFIITTSMCVTALHVNHASLTLVDKPSYKFIIDSFELVETFDQNDTNLSCYSNLQIKFQFEGKFVFAY